MNSKNRQRPIWRPLLPNPARFGRLDEYYIWDEVIVYFDNGQVKVDPKDDAQLRALAEKAKTVDGYVIEVKGHAFTSGSSR